MIEVLSYAAGVVIFLLAIFFSIALHELGHLYFAKRYGRKVSQYMVGFGPTLLSWTWRETEFGIKAVPLGGYVKIIGMFPPSTSSEHARSAGVFEEGVSPRKETASILKLRKSNTGLFAQMVSETRASEFEIVEPGDEDKLFYKLTWPKKIVVMAAGPAVNITLAFLCLLGVYSLHGVHSIEPTGSTVITSVSDCVIPETEGPRQCTASDPVSPAKAAGLQPGDEIVELNGQQVETWAQMSQIIEANDDEQLVIEVVRDGQRASLEPVETVAMTRDVSDDGSGQMATVGFLGVGPETEEVITRGGPIYTMGRMAEMTGHAMTTVVELPVKVWNVAQAIAGQEERAQDGPMSIVGGSRIAGEVTSSDVEGLDLGDKAALLALVVGSFNLFIGIFNLIPLMPLDGWSHHGRGVGGHPQGSRPPAGTSRPRLCRRRPAAAAGLRFRHRTAEHGAGVGHRRLRRPVVDRAVTGLCHWVDTDRVGGDAFHPAGSD